MGTVLQHPLNIFTTLPNNYDEINKRSGNSYTRTNYDCKLGIRTGLKLFLEPMDRDSVKKTMLKQEEIFKQQVRELHRLYQAQKQLMAEIRSDDGTSRSFCHDNRHQSTSQLSSENSRLNRYESFENICLEGPFREPKSFDLEQPVVETTKENIAHDQASSSWRHLRQGTAVEGPDIDTDVELTLSIGCGAQKKKPKHGLHLDSEIGSSVSDPSETKQLRGQDRREEGSDVPVSSKEESSQRPCRNLQGLSLDIEEEMNSNTSMHR
ncbi:uncharacterized protein [Elaeis guineensis]|uniref:Uncharacterized protein LOC105039281 n=1 Tax=Elaeis guineensis var. tenera TaxID=51953 RepID=A0A6I9QSZ2_ELAGV|nr:uncharacterized protein LOC105039281 [Elaeis guineensis]XP_010913686.1 uncharacterized protein LOC105039281 [Elaeis guineensis]XP_010913687.1 uncharacterized protein LOC105039281 [Elaeis guineensis]